MKKLIALAVVALGTVAVTGCLPPPHHRGDDGGYHRRDRDNDRYDRQDSRRPDARPDNRGPGPR